MSKDNDDVVITFPLGTLKDAERGVPAMIKVLNIVLSEQLTSDGIFCIIDALTSYVARSSECSLERVGQYILDRCRCIDIRPGVVEEFGKVVDTLNKARKPPH